MVIPELMLKFSVFEVVLLGLAESATVAATLTGPAVVGVPLITPPVKLSPAEPAPEIVPDQV